MASRADLVKWVRDSLLKRGCRGRIPEVARQIWEEHESDLRESGDLFYTWQYDMRWAALHLDRTSSMPMLLRTARNRVRPSRIRSTSRRRQAATSGGKPLGR